MKRTALKRKTPMRRGGKLKQRSSKMNVKMAGLRQEYEKMFSRSPLCECCRVLVELGLQSGMRLATEPHHPQGRIGKNIHKFIPVCSDCHRRIHDNPKWAEENGLLIKNR